MKAILVIDKPKTCKECPMWTHTYHYDWGREYPVEKCCMGETCPLKEMPKKKQIGGFEKNGEYTSIEYSCGWNDCIDEITGETE